MTARMLEQLEDGPNRLQIVFDASDSAFLAGVVSDCFMCVFVSETHEGIRTRFAPISFSASTFHCSHIVPIQSVGALLNFIYAMACHPEVQTKAQCEIDAVVGRDRLPDFSDRSNLPYVQALISETLRWKVIAPLGAHYILSSIQ
jgi:hypothetical protein